MQQYPHKPKAEDDIWEHSKNTLWDTRNKFGDWSI